MIDFFGVWVGMVCGTLLISVLVNAVIFLLIGLFGRMGFYTLSHLMFLYLAVFVTGMSGWYLYVLFLILALVYLWIQASKFINREQ